MEVKVTDFGEFNGKKVYLFTVENSKGNTIVLTNYGATWVSAIVPDKNGKKDDVLLGFNDLKGYIEDTCYIGSTIGRYANRIENASFSIDGKVYKIATNGTIHSLHGGAEGFSSRVWDSKVETDGVTFSLVSPDGDQGFPGELKATVRYKWNDENTVRIEYSAQTDRPTPINLTNHAYFNLHGEGKILNHLLKINTPSYLLMKGDSIVSGNKEQVENTPFDFRQAKPIGADIDKPHEQLLMCKGYDHSFLFSSLDAKISKDIHKPVIEVCDPESGRILELSTTYFTVHLYTSNFLTSVNPGKKGVKYGEREAFCLEAQLPPNMPNLLDRFPGETCILQPGETYSYATEFHFTTV
ncbi:MAG: galactose mutarotase [Prevotellaceae bacterium]|jgi:aldose 1-epimerase|nr:galactose mutarotase [Prevotellaceae bacterium]